MIRPLSISRAIKQARQEKDFRYHKLISYIEHLENIIKDYEEINYQEQRKALLAIDKTIKEKNKLIEELTNLLEPKEL